MGTISTDKNIENLISDEKESDTKVMNCNTGEDKDVIIQSSVGRLVGSVPVDESEEWKGKELNLGYKFRILKRTEQIWEFQTVIRGTTLLAIFLQRGGNVSMNYKKVGPPS